MQCPEFKNFQDPNDLNKIILGFQTINANDQEKFDKNALKGISICLQGKLNNKGEGAIFNEKAWFDSNALRTDLVKGGKGYFGFISYDKLNEIIEGIAKNKKLYST